MMSKLEMDIMYFKSYKSDLERFIYVESGNLTVKEYMNLVREIERVKEYIGILEMQQTKIKQNVFCYN